ncbi:hypothetical protein [Nonomuraea pusilla]|uniref:DUF885 domain-containing protein n=1 Tax=Nonomuraea pusilla TaxID=46177 RepID=A0A1H7LSU0_9ACTN|nr:hypothetical protein [Nonomuraea pusilla]SEL01535.1 hypothetical protein SAMN05660976_01652 [Nonomuraea pusilla]
MADHDWQRDHALLALRINRLVTGYSGGTAVIYRGPVEWSRQAESEPEPDPGRLADEAARLLESAPTAYLAAHVRAMRAVALRLAGVRAPLPEYARQCLACEVGWVPEETFASAHDRLDAALPPGPGPLAGRLASWARAHTLPDVERLPPLVALAVAETRARTSAFVPLPPDEVVRCRLVSGVPFHAAGAYEGGVTSTIHVNRDLPFNLADLLYVVAHEGHPGHIAESLLKEEHLAVGQGRTEQLVRFMLSPSFLVSEGIGLHAEEIAFPGGEAGEWLAGHVFPKTGITPHDADLAAIHRARNALWGVWGNVALLADEGAPDRDLIAYLRRWGLHDDAEAARALPLLRPSAMAPYIFGYYHGWRLLDGWLVAPDRAARVRRLLTEQLLPGDLATTG